MKKKIYNIPALETTSIESEDMIATSIEVYTGQEADEIFTEEDLLSRLGINLRFIE